MTVLLFFGFFPPVGFLGCGAGSWSSSESLPEAGGSGMAGFFFGGEDW